MGWVCGVFRGYRPHRENWTAVGVPSCFGRGAGWRGGVSTASRRSMPAGSRRSEACGLWRSTAWWCSAARSRRGCRPHRENWTAVGVPSCFGRGAGWRGGVSTASRRSMPAGSRRSEACGLWRSTAWCCSAARSRRGGRPHRENWTAVGVASCFGCGAGWRGGVSTASRRSMPAGFRSRAIALERPLEREGWKTASAGIYSSWLGKLVFGNDSAVGLVACVPFRCAVAQRVPAEAGVPSRYPVVAAWRWTVSLVRIRFSI